MRFQTRPVDPRYHDQGNLPCEVVLLLYDPLIAGQHYLIPGDLGSLEQFTILEFRPTQ